MISTRMAWTVLMPLLFVHLVVQIYTLYRVVNAPSNTVLPFAKIIYPQGKKSVGKFNDYSILISVFL